MKTKLLSLFFVISSLMFAASAGVVSSVKGKAFVQPAGSAMKPIKVNDPVEENSYIITQSGASAVITLSSGSVLSVGPNTKMKIQKETIQNRQGKTESVSLLSGSLKAKINKLSASDSFSVHTPTAVAGIRGTDFSVAAGADGSVNLAVSDGKVNLDNGLGSVDLNANQKAQAAPASGAAPVAAAGEEDIAKWLAEREKTALANPEVTLSKLEAQLSMVSSNAASLAVMSESKAGQEIATNKEAVQSSEAEALKLDGSLMQTASANESILAIAEKVAKKSKDAKVKEKLGSIQRMNKSVEDYNSRVNAALSRLDNKLAEAYKRIDASWKNTEDKLNKSFDGFDKNFKDFEVK